MSVWYAIPVAPDDDPLAVHILPIWKRMGYRLAVLVVADESPLTADFHRRTRTYGNFVDLVLTKPTYRGWASSVNDLFRAVRMMDDSMEWLVTGGADIHPDPLTRAEVIAHQCQEHFSGTMGVMQPSGDKYGALKDKSACVSPWLGKEWCELGYGGHGPLNGDYYHFFADTELAQVAGAQKRLWWRDDLNQFHDHWLRPKVRKAHPKHLDAAEKAHPRDLLLFETRRAQGFPLFDRKEKNRCQQILIPFPSAEIPSSTKPSSTL